MGSYQRGSTTFLAALTASMVGCGGGGGSPAALSVPPAPPTAPGIPIVYLAQDAAGVLELYYVDSGTPGVSRKVNAPLVDGGTVFSFGLSPDLQHVVYTAFQDSAMALELYVVDLATPGMSTRLNSPPVDDSDVRYFRFSPDGTRVVYIADQEKASRNELYLVSLAEPGVSTKLNSSLPVGGNVASAIFSPDGSQVLYLADQQLDERFELFLVELAQPGVSAVVNGPIVAGGGVAPLADDIFPFGSGFGFSPDGENIVYIADQDEDEVRELHSVAVDEPGTSSKLSDTLVANGDVLDFAFSPDSTRVAYCADQGLDERPELYLVDIEVPGVSFRLNPELAAGREVSSRNWSFDPGGTFIVYRADQDADDVFELYRVETASPGASMKLSGPMAPGGQVLELLFDEPTVQVGPDRLQVSYVADQDSDEVYEVYSVDLATPGTSGKLNAPMTFSGASFLQITPDGRQVYYVAKQNNDFLELYRADISAPGASTTVNSALSGGNVTGFLVAPGVGE